MKSNLYIKYGITSRAIILLLLISVYICSCKKSDSPDNPYDNVNYAGSNTNTSEPDPNSIVGLHKNIFSKRCALSGCHDGTFEPDFRTVQSSYSSLVYNPVIKNTVDNVNFFTYRVIPNNISASFIIERLTTSTSDYMPSNGTRLQQNYIDNVKNWIQQGAKDENGNLPVKPDLMPNITGYLIFNTNFTMRFDSIRYGGVPYYAAVVPHDSALYFPFFATDEADSADAVPIGSLTNCRMEFSLNKDGFPSNNVVSAFFNPVPPVWICSVNTGQWAPGTTVYFRFYANDGHHFQDSEFPRTSSLTFYKSLYSIYVQ